MKKIIFTAMLISIVATISSCITSLNPLVDINNVMPFDNCLGNWQDENSGASMKIEKLIGSEADKLFAQQLGKSTIENQLPGMDKKEAAAAKASYVLTYKKEGNMTHMMLLVFTKINGDWYVQTTPLAAILNKEKESVILSPFESKQTYVFAKVSKVTPKNLEFHFMDKEKVSSLIQDGKMALKSEMDDLFNNYLVTASTKHLNLFIAKYGKDSRLYDRNEWGKLRLTSIK